MSAVSPEEAQKLRSQQLAKTQKLGMGFVTVLVLYGIGIAITAQQLKKEAIELQSKISAIQAGESERKRRTQELEDGQKKRQPRGKKLDSI